MSYLRVETRERACACEETVCRPTLPLTRLEGGWSSRGVLFEGSTFQLGYTRCRPHSDAVGPEKTSGANVLTFPRRGVFVMHMPEETFVADANIVIFQNADDTFRTSHPGGHGDDTTWVSVKPALIKIAFGDVDHEPGINPLHPFPRSHGPCSPRAYLLQRMAFEHASRGIGADPIFVSEVVHELVQEAVETSNMAVAGKHAVRMRDSTVKVHIETAEAVKTLLASRYADRLTLEEIAGHVHAAPCHLCRLFRRVVGLPIHRYLNRIRLREAITRFADPSANLAGVATDVGFASHSHFTDAFRREFGVAPSVVRQWMASEDLTDMRRKLGVGKEN
ncbi:MAG: helix-turn-helix transcriptional regulator [Pyrinomonadaceae bacterium]|nr:helix-turn-helix transcriptional regulator [Phycisphaerales bacterium]